MVFVFVVFVFVCIQRAVPCEEKKVWLCVLDRGILTSSLLTSLIILNRTKTINIETLMYFVKYAESTSTKLRRTVNNFNDYFY